MQPFTERPSVSAGASWLTWRAIVESVTRPYPVTAPMIVLLLLVPGYIAIAGRVAGGPLHAPALPLDRSLPLVPAWALVYGSLYLLLILLPVFVVRDEQHIRRLFLTYVAVWVTAYVCFLAYPTRAPRPIQIGGTGFAAWGLRFLYAADPPYNCFPSLHVAHSFVSALACVRVHRRIGLAAIACASFVGLSTLLTKQHYVLDVAAGVLLASSACAVLLGGHGGDSVAASDRRAAPAATLAAAAVVGVMVAGAWIVYEASGRW